MWNYSEKVMDHFLHPRNVGAIADADASAEVGNLACGDALKLHLKIGPDGRIAEAKFQTFGCASAIASSSILTEMVIGKTLEEAAKITNQDIASALGGLPEAKMHCSVMGMEALHAAIADYAQKHGMKTAPPEPDGGDRVVCRCFGITEGQIRRIARENGLRTVAEITDYTKAGGACGHCRDAIRTILDTLAEEAKS